MSDALNPLESHDPDVSELLHGFNVEYDPVLRPSHYTENFGIEPIEFCMASWMGKAAAAWSVIQYVMRYPYKGGVQDLKKARHWLDRLITCEEIEAAKSKQAADMVITWADGGIKR